MRPSCASRMTVDDRDPASSYSLRDWWDKLADLVKSSLPADRAVIDTLIVGTVVTRTLK